MKIVEGFENAKLAVMGLRSLSYPSSTFYPKPEKRYCIYCQQDRMFYFLEDFNKDMTRNIHWICRRCKNEDTSN